MNETTNNYHECEILRTAKNISIQKIDKHYYWTFWDDKKGNQAHGIKFCPYCGKELGE